jgi:hypothetical protein
MGKIKTNKFWTPGEKQVLVKLAQEAKDKNELFEKAKKAFPDRSINSIVSALKRHTDWYKKSKSEVEEKVKRDEKTVQKIDPNADVKKALMQLLQKGPVSIDEAAQNLKKHSTIVLKLASDLGVPVKHQDGKLELCASTDEGGQQPLPKVYRDYINIAVISNPRLGLSTQQLGLIKDFIRDYGEKIDMVLVVGGLIAGKPKVGEEDNYFLETFEEQVAYFVKNWPKLPNGKKYYLINGPTDLKRWSTKRGEPKKNAAFAICQEREDCVYCGSYNKEFPITGTENSLLIWHTKKEDKSIYTVGYPMRNIKQSIRHANKARKGSQIIVVCGYHVIYKAPERENLQVIAVPSMSSPLKSLDLEKRSISPIIGLTVLKVPIGSNQPFKPKMKFIKLSKYAVQRDYLTYPSLDKLEGDKKIVAEALKIQGALRAGEIGRTILKRESQYVQSLLEEMSDFVEYDPLSRIYRLKATLKENWAPVVDFTKIIKKIEKDAYAADIHIGSISEHGNMVIETLKICQEKGIKHIIFAGDSLEGIRHFKGHAVEIYLPASMGFQRQLLFKIFEKANQLKLLEGLQIDFISGQHELDAYKEHGHGHDDIELLVKELNTIKPVFRYLGRHYGFYELNGLKTKVVHPSGGLPKGDTYRIQNFIEELKEPVDVLVLGHLHVPVFIVYQDVVGLQCGTFKAQDDYLAEKGKYPDLGFWTIEYEIDQDNDIISITPEFHQLSLSKKKRVTIEIKGREIKVQNIEYEL